MNQVRVSRLTWLWCVVALQVAIPASYYVRSTQPDDERFAWRMFSGVRMKRCAARARAEGDALVMHDVPLRGALHGSWVHSIERGRIRVIQQFLRSRCAPDVRRVTLERRCEGVDARVPAKVEVYEFMCAAGEFHMTGVD